MTFQDLYLGQHVRILSWDGLRSISCDDGGYGIYLPDSTFFNKKMKYLCGATLTIVNKPSHFVRNKRYLSSDIFQFDDPSLGLRSWLLSPAMLAPLNESSPVIPPVISFDQLLTGGELSQ